MHSTCAHPSVAVHGLPATPPPPGACPLSTARSQWCSLDSTSSSRFQKRSIDSISTLALSFTQWSAAEPRCFRQPGIAFHWRAEGTETISPLCWEMNGWNSPSLVLPSSIPLPPFIMVRSFTSLKKKFCPSCCACTADSKISIVMTRHFVLLSSLSSLRTFVPRSLSHLVRQHFEWSLACSGRDRNPRANVGPMNSFSRFEAFTPRGLPNPPVRPPY